MDIDRPAIRLLPARQPASLAPLDESAARVAQAVRQRKNLVVLGSAGTGKTNLALTLLAQAVQEGRDALLLAPTRARANALRAIAAHVTKEAGRGMVRVRTPASYAFSVVAASHAGRPDPLPAPELLMGATEDATLAQLIDPHAWAPLPPEAVTTSAFRSQLRNLLARCGELGIDGEELARLGEHEHIEIWRQAAPLVAAWDAQGRPRAHNRAQVRKMDSVRIQDRAIEALARWDEDEIAAAPPIPDLIIVDDYQDCTNATARLLTELATPGRDGRATEVVVLGNPDVAVETFRGGAPSLLAEAQRHAVLNAECMILAQCHRGGAALRTLWADQEQRVPVTGTANYRLRALQAHQAAASLAPEEEASPTRPEGVQALVAPSAEQEISHIARLLRAEHIHASTPWDTMAVIVRSSAAGRAMARELRRRGVPVNATPPAVLLRTEPAAAALLRACQDALHGRYGSEDAQADPQAIMTLLRSPLVGLSELDLRRVRRRLRQGWVGQSPQAPEQDISITQIVCSAALAERFEDAVKAESLEAQAAALCRAARMVARSRAVVEDYRARDLPVDCEDLLWALWDESGCADIWRDQALATGSTLTPGTAMMAESAENMLDVVTALFKRAEVWAERHPGLGAQAFLAELAGELLPSDSVAPHGVRPSGVDVCTPASAVGRSWDVVVVAGLQRDTWPDLRVRDTITRAGLLVEVACGRTASEHREGDALTQRSAREHVRGDERRMFLAALTRAQRRLVLTAYSSGDDQPSVFFLESCRAAGIEILDSAGQPMRVAETGDFTLRGLMGRLRHALIRGHLPSASPLERERAQGAAVLLAHLARESVHEAVPAHWQDIRMEVSGLPLVSADRPIKVSPSDVEALVTCPLRWFLERHGATSSSSQAQQIGMSLHALAEEGQRNGTRGAHVRENLDALIEQMHYPDTTVGARQADRLRQIGERLAVYMDSVPGRVDVEETIDATLVVSPDLPQAHDPAAQGLAHEEVPTELVRIRGRIDRLEFLESHSPQDEDQPGNAAGGQVGPRVRIVDIKTGRSAYPNAARNPQLAMYRLALQEQGYQVEGGALVLLGQDPPKKNNGMPVLSPSNAALDPSPDEDGRAWDRTMLFEAAHAARGPLFEARLNTNCRYCRVKDCCPMQVNGGSVVG